MIQMMKGLLIYNFVVIIEQECYQPGFYLYKYKKMNDYFSYLQKLYVIQPKDPPPNFKNVFLLIVCEWCANISTTITCNRNTVYKSLILH